LRALPTDLHDVDEQASDRGRFEEAGTVESDFPLKACSGHIVYRGLDSKVEIVTTVCGIRDNLDPIHGSSIAV
jgi:hypothetical protein